MKKNAKLINKYCRQIKQCLPCPRKQTQRILTEISSSVQDYLDSNPNAAYSDIEMAFGTPLQIATAQVDAMDTAELVKYLRIKKKIVTGIIGTCLILISIWGIAVAIVLIDAVMTTHGYGVYS